MRPERVSEETVTRICDYLRVLTMMESRGQATTSSREIGWWAGVKDSQVRKDLSYFVEFGRRGVGYFVPELRRNLQEIIGVKRKRPTIVVGAGNLGSALAHYPGFAARGFDIVAIFDNNPARIGHRIGGLPIHSMKELRQVVEEHCAEIAIITVPEGAAQEVAQQVAEVGITAIVNFAPVLLNLPEGILLRNVDLARELETLCYYLPPGETEQHNQ